MHSFDKAQTTLKSSPAVWLVTGAAGFIGSNLLEWLLRHDQQVIVLDNLSTGHCENLAQVQSLVSKDQWKKCTSIEGDIRDLDCCRRAAKGVHYVLHQAALGSVPASIDDPLATHQSNVDGFINILRASQENGVKRFVYASSSSVYGDDTSMPQVEEKIGNCLSPYAASKRINEIYADVFGRCYGIETVGLRYFNVFGPRQDPNGAYAAVIPKWISTMLQNGPVVINGDGSTSRDFCYIANVIQANILAATVPDKMAVGQYYNIALGRATSLSELYDLIRTRLVQSRPSLLDAKPQYRDFRQGDVLHSRADIAKARRLLGFEPSHDIAAGLDEALHWYVKNSAG